MQTRDVEQFPFEVHDRKAYNCAHEMLIRPNIYLYLTSKYQALSSNQLPGSFETQELVKLTFEYQLLLTGNNQFHI